MPRHHQDIWDFLSSQPAPEQIFAFRPSPEAIARLRCLLKREIDGEITATELEEIDEWEQLEHMFVMLKADALSKLTGKND